MPERVLQMLEHLITRLFGNAKACLSRSIMQKMKSRIKCALYGTESAERNVVNPHRLHVGLRYDIPTLFMLHLIPSLAKPRRQKGTLTEYHKQAGSVTTLGSFFSFRNCCKTALNLFESATEIISEYPHILSPLSKIRKLSFPFTVCPSSDDFSSSSRPFVFPALRFPYLFVMHRGTS